MIKKSLISLMYEAASIQRWNDHIRPWTTALRSLTSRHTRCFMLMCLQSVRAKALI